MAVSLKRSDRSCAAPYCAAASCAPLKSSSDAACTPLSTALPVSDAVSLMVSIVGRLAKRACVWTPVASKDFRQSCSFLCRRLDFRKRSCLGLGGNLIPLQLCKSCIWSQQSMLATAWHLWHTTRNYSMPAQNILPLATKGCDAVRKERPTLGMQLLASVLHAALVHTAK